MRSQWQKACKDKAVYGHHLREDKTDSPHMLAHGAGRLEHDRKAVPHQQLAALTFRRRSEYDHECSRANTTNAHHRSAAPHNSSETGVVGEQR